MKVGQSRYLRFPDNEYFIAGLQSRVYIIYSLYFPTVEGFVTWYPALVGLVASVSPDVLLEM